MNPGEYLLWLILAVGVGVVAFNVLLDVLEWRE